LIKRLKKIGSPYFHSLKRSFYKGKNIYLIYTMGKVGSASIYTSLKRMKPYSAIFHVHFLSRHWLVDTLPTMHQYFHSNITLGEEILAYIEKHPQKRIKIITLVREPVARAVSELFQNWQASYQNIMEVDDQQLIDRLARNDFGYTLDWFDTEFKAYTGVDIFSLDFDREKGYASYSFDKLDILCIKLEKLNEVAEESISSFIDMPFKLIGANQSKHKFSSQKYQAIKDNLKIEPQGLDRLYESKLVQHFYTPEEIRRFKLKWGKH